MGDPQMTSNTTLNTSVAASASPRHGRGEAHVPESRPLDPVEDHRRTVTDLRAHVALCNDCRSALARVESRAGIAAIFSALCDAGRQAVRAAGAYVGLKLPRPEVGDE